MKHHKRVTKRGKVAGLRASAAGRGKRAPDVLAKMTEFYRPIKKPITLRLDADVIAWFKRKGRGYQTRINQALRKLMLEER